MKLIKKYFSYALIIMAIFIASQFMYVLPIHIGAFFLTIAGVIAADIYGLRWISGHKQTLNEKTLHRLHLYVAHGLVAAITSGAIMFYPVADYLLTDPAFQLKMFLVLALVVNSFVIGKHMLLASSTPFKTLPNKTKITLVASGLVSSSAWIGTYIVAKFFLGM